MKMAGLRSGIFIDIIKQIVYKLAPKLSSTFIVRGLNARIQHRG
jgi:hypothetical protein